MEFKGSHEMIVDQRRTIVQQSRSTIKSILDAVVELLTNSDDSYRRIEDNGKKPKGVISVFVHRIKGGECRELKVTDFAQGMDEGELLKALEFGAETSGFEGGRSVRGLFGKGLKEAIIALGEGEVYTCKNDKGSAVKIWVDEKIIKEPIRYSDINKFDNSEETRRQLGIEEIGKNTEVEDMSSWTVTKIKVAEDKKIPDFKKFKPQIEKHYALRDIISSPARKTWLEFDDQSSKRNKKFTTPLEYSYPEGELVFNEDINIPKYEDRIHLKIWESDIPLNSPRINPSGEAGICIKTKGATLDNKLFKYENEPAALYFWGEALCLCLENRIREELREHGATNLINPNRGGIEWNHDYCQMLQNAIEKILGPSTQKKKEELEKGIQRKEVPEATKKMIGKLCALLNKFAKNELVQTEGKVNWSEIDELTIYPDRPNIEVDKPRTLTIYAPLDLLTIGVNPICKIESDNPNNIQCLTEKVELSGHPEYPTLYCGTFMVIGRVLGEKATLSAKLGENEALAQVTVAPPKPIGPKGSKGEPKIRKGGFIGDIKSNEQNNPSQRVSYKEGIIEIYVKFPVVAKYLSAGLEGAETLEGRTMLGELVGEAFCRTLARGEIERNPPPSRDEGYIDAFNLKVDELQQKYLHEIHNLITAWKVK